MPSFATRSPASALLVTLLVCAASGATTPAQAVPSSYFAYMDGLSEATPNSSPATGHAQIIIDPEAHTLEVHIQFSDLVSPNTACHIHAATAVPGTGTAGVATTTPTFTGFPTGTTSGTYDHTFDTTVASSFNATFVTNNGGTAAGAEAALFQAIADGRAYVNLHTSTYTAGEIRGFLTHDPITPVTASTWGTLKALYR